MKKKSINRGASFIEVVIIVAIVVIIVSGLVAGTTSSIKSATFANLKSQATKYAQEGIEIARRDRDSSWYAFYNRRNQTWCLDKAGVWTNGGSGCSQNIDNTFARSVRMDWIATDPDPLRHKMEVTVTVVWRDGTGSHKSEIKTYFTKWR